MTSTVSGTTAALIVAGGRGLRAGGAVPKQYAVLAGEAVLRRTLRVFLDHPAIDRVRVVIHPDDRDRYRAAIADHPKLGPPVDGGASRKESVRHGLEALADDPPARVLIHDAVRPFLSPALIGRVVGGLDADEAVLPAVAVADTLKRADERGFTAGTVPRDRLYGAQTPQAFRFGAILDAHRRAGDLAQDFTDDAAVAEWAGIPVRLAPGEAENIKLTTAEDLEAAERRLAAGLTDIRVGSGYDVHAFGPGSGIVLGGVRIDHDRSLVGHSDADVALHALTDAVLGALAEGDIGQHFPPSDPSLRGADSARFLAFAAERVRARGGAIAHLDLAILAETPRIGPHRDAMRERIAAICGMDVGRVAVKATTNERLGFIGRQEGLAALATATVRLPWTR